MYVVDSFTAKTNRCKSPWKKTICFLLGFFPLDQICKIKTRHMVASEHPEVIDRSQWCIATDVIDSQEADADGYIDNDFAALDEEKNSGSGEAVVRTYIIQSGTEDMEEVQWVVICSFLSSYMLKPISLLTHVVNNNKKSQ